MRVPGKPYDDSALRQLETWLTNASSEEIALRTAKLRASFQRYAEQARFQANAKAMWEQWLRTRPQ